MGDRDKELNDLYRVSRPRCRALLLNRLRAAGGSVALAAKAEGLPRDVFWRWLGLVDLKDAPTRIRRQLREPAPVSAALERWLDVVEDVEDDVG